MTKHSYHEGKMTLHFILGGSRYRDSLQARRLAIRTPLKEGRREIYFPTPDQPGRQVHPAPCTMGTRAPPRR